MKIKPISTKLVGANAAAVLTAGGLGKSDSIAYDKLQTFVMVRREGRWMCAHFRTRQ
jgi:hypothetical protein